MNRGYQNQSVQPGLAYMKLEDDPEKYWAGTIFDSMRELKIKERIQLDDIACWELCMIPAMITDQDLKGRLAVGAQARHMAMQVDMASRAQNTGGIMNRLRNIRATGNPPDGEHG